MKRGYLLPLGLLAATLAFTLWNSAYISSETHRWHGQLETARALAQAEDWPAVSAVLETGYADWSSRQNWFHIVLPHNAIDDAEAMYHRCMAFAATQEPSEFQAEVSDLMTQLRLLAELEQLNIKNIL